MPTAHETKATIHGVPASMGCMGPILFMLDHKQGEMKPCMPHDKETGTQSKEFLEKFPFGGVPALEAEGGKVKFAESNTILRYLGSMAGKYSTESGASAITANATVDWAMDVFSNKVYPPMGAIIYPVFGYMPAVEGGKDGEEMKKRVSAVEEMIAKFFAEFYPALNEGKFCGGSETPTIADYKVLPFLYCLNHKGMEAQTGYTPSKQVVTFVENMLEAMPADGGKGMLESAGGYSFKEILDGKM